MRNEADPANIRLEHHSCPHPYHRVDGDQGNQGKEFGLITVTQIVFSYAESTLLEGGFLPPKPNLRSYKSTNSDDSLRERGIRVYGWVAGARDVAIDA